MPSNLISATSEAIRSSVVRWSGRLGSEAPVDAHERGDECRLHSVPLGRRDAGRVTHSDSGLDDGDEPRRSLRVGKVFGGASDEMVSFLLELCEASGDVLVVAGGSGGVDLEAAEVTALRCAKQLNALFQVQLLEVAALVELCKL